MPVEFEAEPHTHTTCTTSIAERCVDILLHVTICVMSITFSKRASQKCSCSLSDTTRPRTMLLDSAHPQNAHTPLSVHFAVIPGSQAEILQPTTAAIQRAVAGHCSGEWAASCNCNFTFIFSSPNGLHPLYSLLLCVQTLDRLEAYVDAKQKISLLCR
eukprot:1156649-Pelagomonas_calceolata.AAC.2